MREGRIFTKPPADHDGAQLLIWPVAHRGLEEESVTELPQ